MSDHDAGMTLDDKLVYMMNQIARNFAAMGHDKAVAATEDHVLHFWDPRMKARIVALAAGGDAGLSPIAQDVVTAIRAGVEPAPQTGATRFAGVDGTGASDAG